MAGDHEPERPDEAEGGPVKTFLEHLEDFRWVLIKSIVALFLGMILCLIGANHVVQIIKWPLDHAYNYHPNKNQTVVVSFGTNHVGNFQTHAGTGKIPEPGDEPFRCRHRGTAPAGHQPGPRLADQTPIRPPWPRRGR